MLQLFWFYLICLNGRREELSIIPFCLCPAGLFGQQVNSIPASLDDFAKRAI
jgi:hypothetical protein